MWSTGAPSGRCGALQTPLWWSRLHFHGRGLCLQGVRSCLERSLCLRAHVKDATQSAVEVIKGTTGPSMQQGCESESEDAGEGGAESGRGHDAVPVPSMPRAGAGAALRQGKGVRSLALLPSSMYDLPFSACSGRLWNPLTSPNPNLNGYVAGV